MAEEFFPYTKVEQWRTVLACYGIMLIISGSIGVTFLMSTLYYKYKFANDPGDKSARSRTSGTHGPSSADRRSRNKRMNLADELLVALSLSEFAGVWVLILPSVIFLLHNFDLAEYSTMACILRTFSIRVSTNMSVAMFCIFSAQRALIMQWPLASRTWLPRGRVYICIWLGVAFILLKHIPIPIFLRLRPSQHDARGYVCTAERAETESYIWIWKGYEMFESIIHNIVGYTIMLVSNVWLTVSLHQISREAKKGLMSEMSKNRPPVPKETIRSSWLILILSTIHATSTIPYFILIIVNRFLASPMYPEKYTSMARHGSAFLVYTSHALNYYVYYTVSKRHRTLGKQVIKQVWCGRELFSGSLTKELEVSA